MLFKRFYITYEFEGSDLTMRQGAFDENDAVRVGKEYAQQMGMKFLRISLKSPKPRHYSSPLSSLATYAKITRTSGSKRQVSNG